MLFAIVNPVYPAQLNDIKLKPNFPTCTTPTGTSKEILNGEPKGSETKNFLDALSKALVLKLSVERLPRQQKIA